MKKYQKFILPLVVFLLLIASITLNIFEVKNPNTTPFKQNDLTEKIQTKTKVLGEKLTLPLNDTTIEMKLDRAETAIVTVEGDSKNLTTKRIYFQIYATIKNIGAKPFSFNSTPVFGVSSDNFILLAKNTGSFQDEYNKIITADGVVPNQDLNLIKPFFDIKPGSEKSGFFLFENEIQTLQLISNGTPYIWQTMKVGVNVKGQELATHTPITNTENTITFEIRKQQNIAINEKNLKLLFITITNNSNDEITPLSFIPKYGTTIPGEVHTIELLDAESVKQFEGSIIDENTKLSAHSKANYIIAFDRNIASIFPQSPLISDYTNIKISV